MNELTAKAKELYDFLSGDDKTNPHDDTPENVLHWLMVHLLDEYLKHDQPHALTVMARAILANTFNHQTYTHDFQPMCDRLTKLCDDISN